MVLFITPFTWILAAEMAAASWVAGRSATIERRAPGNLPPSQHSNVWFLSTLAPMANGPTTL